MIRARGYSRGSAAGGKLWSRTWRDALGRPVLYGSIQLTPVQVRDIVPAPVTVEVRGGTTSTTLAPGTYQLTGQVVTVDKHTVNLPAETITVA